MDFRGAVCGQFFGAFHDFGVPVEDDPAASRDFAQPCGVLGAQGFGAGAEHFRGCVAAVAEVDQQLPYCLGDRVLV